MTKDEALKLALEALENNRQTHHYCEDTWYSCPKHEDGCANDSEGDECNCGADKANAEIDKAITAIKEALAEQDSKDKEQAKTDSFVRQLDEALAQPEPWEKFCDSNCVWTDHHPDCKLAQPEQEPKCGAIIEVFGKDWRLEYLSLPVGKHKLYTQQYTYTTPPQRKPLSDEEILTYRHMIDWTAEWSYINFARAIEAKLRSKNS